MAVLGHGGGMSLLRRLAAMVAAALWLGMPAEAETPGCLKLDSLTLDRFTAIPDYRVLVKIDEPAPYGDAQDAFVLLCQLAYTVPKFFVAEVPCQAFNDMENDDVRQRFNLTKEDFPAYFLFAGGDVARNGLKYSGPIQAANMVAWLRANSVNMPSISTIDELDDLVEEFLGTPSEEVLARTRATAEKYSTDTKAAWYVRVMERTLAKGASYAANEVARVNLLLKGKVSRKQAAEMSDKLTVLKVFARMKACDLFECPKDHKKKFDAAGIIGSDAETCCHPPCEDAVEGDLHDSQGHHCDYYETPRTAKECGDWDTGEFRANSLCCACGGGTVKPPERTEL